VSRTDATTKPTATADPRNNSEIQNKRHGKVQTDTKDCMARLGAVLKSMQGPDVKTKKKKKKLCARKVAEKLHSVCRLGYHD
jgi:hypothetical protein